MVFHDMKIKIIQSVCVAKCGRVFCVLYLSKSLRQICRKTGKNGKRPQSFHKNKDVTFMFRVKNVFKECQIYVHGNGIDRKIKKLAVVPSEMQKVNLKKEDLMDLDSELTWEIIE